MFYFIVLDVEENVGIFQTFQDFLWIDVFEDVLYVARLVGVEVLWVAWHINSCRLFYAKSIFYTNNQFYFK